MSDEVIECIDCGRKFVWSYGEQRYYKEHGLAAPKRCQVCRSRQRERSWWADPVYRFGLVTFGFAAVSAAILWHYGDLDPLLSWLLAVTLVTLLTWRYDKGVAGLQGARVPEKVLLALTLAGGTLGAWVGMKRFHHKTAKASFRSRFLLIVVVQVALVIAYVLIKLQ